MINWNFPSNNYGQITGLNDAGIETFRGNPWDSLAREINQNSCDAKDKNNPGPVEVHFNLSHIPLEYFPQKDEFIKILKSCLEYWKDNTKTTRFFENALSIMELDKIPFLKISDYNTTGLTGADDEYRGGWHNLIKSVGSSDKDSQSGGSFGIGKHAPFACSDLRTVFYGTKEVESGAAAFQGVAKLVTHLNEAGNPTQGTGYFGEVEKNKPIVAAEDMYEFFTRSDVGTDIFIAGFNEHSGWEEKVIKSVLENFFIAILNERLIVRVGETTINANSLSGLLDKYTKNDPDCLSYQYYEAYTLSSRHHFPENDFFGLGEIDLFVLPGKDLPKRVAMVRGTGMKIYDKGSFRTPFKFAGVMIAKGEKINEFLRKIEPPTHNAWEPDRHEDPEYAKGMIRKLYAWINERVRSISITNSLEDLDVEGLSQYLPDNYDAEVEAQPHSQHGSEGEKTTPKDIEIELNHRRMKPTTFNGINEGYAGNDETAAGTEDGKFSQNGENRSSIGDTKGSEQGEGEGNSRTSGEDDKSDQGSSQRGGSLDGKVNPISSAVNKNLRLIHSRIFCMNPASGTYKVSMQTNEDGAGYIGIKVVGEVGGEAASVKSVVIQQTGESVDLKNNGKIGPISFYKDKKCDLVVTLKDSLRCALEVSVYAN
ncbi:hypothetical protein AWU65_14555 [Paenibacillus glucanolyticus]|uniref:Uncharacterized protein n=1 Tax=Paenibacillus glucanolyticus TaxID=59843 RepID=A0A163K8R9_9BACL|nr:hypothetical protein [Paenibacillus glucanolyticus]KZS47059.1 hypothetical protein AWU65_14555 [Paenibacillus glucanolyticus]